MSRRRFIILCQVSRKAPHTHPIRHICARLFFRRALPSPEAFAIFFQKVTVTLSTAAASQ